ncbi:hypothetical protein JCM33374_g6157 [Metschnikowia sp. JCM 33374]|nr:hypothetical protein JCM33374_g6157 [Metschnikowia sp. JCM 33374]
MSELPISCFRCRRRKIKCNKRKPCNQCIKHNVPCQFPSKFRNVSFDEPHSTHNPSNTDTSGSSNADSTDHVKSESPADVSRLEEQVRTLELENQYIREQYERRFGPMGINSNDDDGHDHGHDHDPNAEPPNTKPFKITGETTEKGEKYYGPLSSNNMTEDFDTISSNNASNKSSSAAGLKHHSWTSDPFKIADSDHDSDASSEPGHYTQKEPLPWVVARDESVERNLMALKALVRNFFDTKTYDYFISEGKVLRFIDEYASVPEMTWEGADDLLLLHMILILSVQRLNPTKYNDICKRRVSNFQQMWKAVKSLKKSLFRGFSKLRHNLVNESYVTVQAYILCTEWEFIEQRYEESWSMMFHCCSIAYALGLHVVTKASSSFFENMADDANHPSGSGNGSSNSKDGYEDYFVDELPKLRVWFALRNLNSQMCSILGRPNPIMIQVNHVSLPTTSVSNVEDAEKLNNLTNSQLKSGLSECIRLSNSNMIESFLSKVSMDNVLTINLQFTEEIDKLTYYLSPQYESSINDVVKKIDTLTDMPTTVTRKDVLVDLVVLHVNRVKLLEPFLDQSPPNKDALNYIMGSILLFYEHTCELVSEFVKSEIPRILESNEAKEGEIRLDKVFIFRDPFFSSFIYQGIVVTFILVSIKANDFIRDNNGDFITQVEGQLHMLLGLHSSISKLVKENIHLWSRSNIFLMKKILHHIGIMKQAFKDKSSGQTNLSFNGFDYDPQVAEMLGNNLKDPFWVVNPENSPNFLGISDDLEDNSVSMSHNGSNLMMMNPQSSKMRVSNYPQFNSQVQEDQVQNSQLHQSQLQQSQLQHDQLQSSDQQMPLYVPDPMLERAQAQFNQMSAEVGFDNSIDIDGDGSGDLDQTHMSNL